MQFLTDKLTGIEMLLVCAIAVALTIAIVYYFDRTKEK